MYININLYKYIYIYFFLRHITSLFGSQDQNKSYNICIQFVTTLEILVKYIDLCPVWLLGLLGKADRKALTLQLTESRMGSVIPGCERCAPLANGFSNCFNLPPMNFVKFISCMLFPHQISFLPVFCFFLELYNQLLDYLISSHSFDIHRSST